MTGLRKNRPGPFKSFGRRTEWRLGGGGSSCYIRGTGRRVIVVRSPDPEVFEEAIFVLREDRMKNAGPQQVMEEARRAADAYLRKNSVPVRRQARGIRGLWIGLGAAVLGGLTWMILHFMVL